MARQRIQIVLWTFRIATPLKKLIPFVLPPGKLAVGKSDWFRSAGIMAIAAIEG